jgi:hypothetical protein
VFPSWLTSKTFYDQVQWEPLMAQAVEVGFPPLVALLAVQAYAGTRYLTAEGLVSEAIAPAKGMLAGCPHAPALSKVALWDVCQRFVAQGTPANLDTWLDDIELGPTGQGQTPGPLLKLPLRVSGFWRASCRVQGCRSP